jgi:hypothetical protein
MPGVVFCAVEGCDRSAAARGFCAMHYLRWWRHGDPLVVLPAGGPRSPSLVCRCSAPDPSRSWSFAPGGFGPNDEQPTAATLGWEPPGWTPERHRARVAAGPTYVYRLDVGRAGRAA